MSNTNNTQSTNATVAFTPCSSQDNKVCTDINPDTCCYYYKVMDENTSPTPKESEMIKLLGLAGMPLKQNEEKYLCQPADTMKGQFEWTEEMTGYTWRGYCIDDELSEINAKSKDSNAPAGAVAKAYGLVSLVAMLVSISSF